jgi:hypothetical protein
MPPRRGGGLVDWQVPRVSPWAIFMLSLWESRDAGLGWAEIPICTIKTKRGTKPSLTTPKASIPAVFDRLEKKFEKMPEST